MKRVTQVAYVCFGIFAKVFAPIGAWRLDEDTDPVTFWLHHFDEEQTLERNADSVSMLFAPKLNWFSRKISPKLGSS